MDAELMRLLAKLKILATKKQLAIDLVRLTADKSYAKEALARLMDTDDEEVIVLALTVLDALGCNQPDIAVTAKLADAEVPASKYIGRLR